MSEKGSTTQYVLQECLRLTPGGRTVGAQTEEAPAEEAPAEEAPAEDTLS